MIGGWVGKKKDNKAFARKDEMSGGKSMFGVVLSIVGAEKRAPTFECRFKTA